MIRKIRILEEAERSGNLRATARKFQVQPGQIRRWRRNVVQIREVADCSPEKLTLHPGKSLTNAALDANVLNWMMDQGAGEHCVTTNDIMCKAVSLDASFKGGDSKKLRGWVYGFIKRHQLNVRSNAGVNQWKSGEMGHLKGGHYKRAVTRLSTCSTNSRFFVNNDDGASVRDGSKNKTDAGDDLSSLFKRYLLYEASRQEEEKLKWAEQRAELRLMEKVRRERENQRDDQFNQLMMLLASKKT